MEIYKDIPNYPNYQVSNLGNVKSLKRKDIVGRDIGGIILKNKSDKDGYNIVNLYLNGKSETAKVHRLVTELFIGDINKGYVVNHINFIKNDNRVENLEIVTIRQNSNKKHIKSSSKYVGVSYNKLRNRYKSTIYINKDSVFLGWFINEIDASNAYQNKLKEL